VRGEHTNGFAARVQDAGKRVTSDLTSSAPNPWLRFYSAEPEHDDAEILGARLLKNLVKVAEIELAFLALDSFQ